MAHTQGRLSVERTTNPVGASTVIGRNGSDLLFGATFEPADAAELVRRWNAFEPGGAVEQAREALGALIDDVQPMYAVGRIPAEPWLAARAALAALEGEAGK